MESQAQSQDLPNAGQARRVEMQPSTTAAAAGSQGQQQQPNNNVSNNGNNAGTNAPRKNNNRNRQRKGRKGTANTNANSTESATAPGNESAAGTAPANQNNNGRLNNNNNNNNNNQNIGKKKPPRKRGGGRGVSGAANGTDVKQAGSAENTTAPGDQQGQPQQPKKAANKKRNNRKNKNNNNNRNFPWRQYLPEDAVDPISLDHLNQLRYPPFALCAEEPYVPVPEWPVPSADSEKNKAMETEEERQRRLLAEQWSDHKVAATVVAATDDEKKNSAKNQERHYNLFDGRALAYYMVSQLQFIDPLNRRDLTRDELVNLDRYLQRHGFRNLNVTEAYDAKGITLSTAGAVANTAAGRAAILQQEASVLLNALFGATSVTAAATTNARSSSQPRGNNNTLASQYMAHETSTQQRLPPQRRRQQPGGGGGEEDTGISGSEGFLVIDDNMNPGLRGTAPEFIPSGSTLYSARHIAERFGHQTLVREHEFPSLPTPAAPITSAPSNDTKAKPEPKPPSKTLAKIGSAVQKTDPEELQRQFEAREEARRKAMMSNLTFGATPVSNIAGPTYWDNMNNNTSTVNAAATLTDAQMERNRTLAEALNVVPSQTRTPITTGWARPTGPENDMLTQEQRLEFAVVYPDTLILQVRERMDFVLKLEKKWKKFLTDDTAASLPLNRMDRPTRAIVHEYATFWRLHTESFDPEPNRYIHCVKLRDTSAPFPLLSDAVRQWRGPTKLVTTAMSEQPAGQTSRELPPPPDRAPLVLKPRQAGTTAAATTGGGIPMSGSLSRIMTSDEPGAMRFASLERERPKLELQKRTLPLELPPVESTTTGDEDIQRLRRRLQEKERKEREAAERKQRLLEAAFASESEDEDSGGKKRRGGKYDDDDDSSVWDEPEPLYQGDFDE